MGWKGERQLRAIWFALFATTGLIVGGFVIGYGVALLGAPAPSGAPAVVPLPTLAPVLPGTDHATGVDGDGGASGSTASAAATPVSDASADVTTVAGVGGQPRLVTTPTVPVSESRDTSTDFSLPAEHTIGNGLVVSLESIDVNTAQGGVELLLELRNGSQRGVTFSFLPESDLSVTDGQGQSYDMRWSEYVGMVSVAPGEKVQLVRAFFAGLPSNGTHHLLVRVGHAPQLPESSWWVPVSR
ncbi:MAG TPA: hypothetical protein VHS06_03070 [Chloroflexota bacterium]|nr:hypothetical protein [Chloroflexota bacterium]